MNSLPDIKNRMKAISDIEKVTGAMETVSIAKMSKALSEYRQYEPYFSKFSDVMKDVVARTKYSAQRYFGHNNGKRSTFLVVGSDKGLVGGFNHDLFAYASGKIKEFSAASVLTVGKSVSDFFKKQKFDFPVNIENLEKNPSFEYAERIAKYLLMLYDENKTDRVFIVYTDCGLTGMKPDMMQLVPFASDSDNESEYTGELYYESDDETILNRLYFSYLSATIYGCLLKSSVSEHMHRRHAMNTATKNSKELLAELNMEYNRARQSAVTSELTDMMRLSE